MTGIAAARTHRAVIVSIVVAAIGGIALLAGVQRSAQGPAEEPPPVGAKGTDAPGMKDGRLAPIDSSEPLMPTYGRPVAPPPAPLPTEPEPPRAQPPELPRQAALPATPAPPQPMTTPAPAPPALVAAEPPPRYAEAPRRGACDDCGIVSGITAYSSYWELRVRLDDGSSATARFRRRPPLRIRDRVRIEDGMLVPD